MQASGFQGIDNAVASGSCHANDVTLDAGLRDQELEEVSMSADVSLSHPLGTMTVTPLYLLAPADSSLATYKARLDKSGEVQMAS
jgi:hypothetical protein